MKVLITGATGMVGKGVLLECLDHPEIQHVLSISRTRLGIQHEKLQELIHADFEDFSSVSGDLAGYDACYLCMGVSSAGMREEEYKRITYDFTLSLARLLKETTPDMTCVYVSGEGTDSSEKSRTMWARVKGKTENDLLALGFRQAFMFRPGAIIPLRGIKSRTKLYQFIYDYMMWLIKFVKWISPQSVVNTTQIGLAMIYVTLRGHDRSILAPRDILAAAANLNLESKSATTG